MPRAVSCVTVLARTGSVAPTSGATLLLATIASVVVGGVGPSGARARC
jgi:ribose/xylose/arabinose/galactoside ABC-type transport system permease subunit